MSSTQSEWTRCTLADPLTVRGPSWGCGPPHLQMVFKAAVSILTLRLWLSPWAYSSPNQQVTRTMKVYPLPSSLEHTIHPLQRSEQGWDARYMPSIPGPASSGTPQGGRCQPGRSPSARGRRGGSCAHIRRSDAGSFLESRKRIWGVRELLCQFPPEKSSSYITKHIPKDTGILIFCFTVGSDEYSRMYMVELTEMQEENSRKPTAKLLPRSHLGFIYQLNLYSDITSDSGENYLG